MGTQANRPGRGEQAQAREGGRTGVDHCSDATVIPFPNPPEFFPSTIFVPPFFLTYRHRCSGNFEGIRHACSDIKGPEREKYVRSCGDGGLRGRPSPV